MRSPFCDGALKIANEGNRQSMSDSNWLLAEHQRRNQTTLDANSLFEPHRQRVMQLLMQVAGPTSGRLCVLGSGNCNDLDLIVLLNAFEELVLVDVDRATTELAITTGLKGSQPERIHVAESTDVTGVFKRLQAADVKELGASAAAEILKLLTITLQLPLSPFDCVVSTCLLSQLIDSVVLALGTDHPSVVPIILALRKQHLRTVVHNLSAGGRGLLVFDFVSSHSLPGLMQIDDSRLNQTLIEAINAKNFFTGLNPFAVQAELQTHSDFAGLINDIRLHPPWRWDIGEKQFAVSAISFRRSSAASPIAPQ